MNPDKVQIIEIDEKSFNSEILMSKLPVLAVFWAPWSRPCQIINSSLDKVAAACAGNLKIVKVNADNNLDLSLEYGIQSIPTLLFFVDGHLRAQVIGTASEEAILSKLTQVLNEVSKSNCLNKGNNPRYL